MMKKIELFLLCVVTSFFSCNDEDVFFNSFPILDDVQYSFYVAEALDAMNMPRPEGSYNYPCLPGMPAWKDLKDSEDMKRAYSVPKNILKKQSTQAVIQAMWEHYTFPMLIGFSSNLSIQQSLDKVLPDWDIYQELINRPDAASCLVDRYYRMNLTKTIHACYNNSLQLLLSQTVFLDQLVLEDKIQLAKEMVTRIDVLKKIYKLEEKPVFHEDLSTYFCLVRIMTNSKYAPILAWMEKDESIVEFESLGLSELMVTDSFLMKILELSTNFINNN